MNRHTARGALGRGSGLLATARPLCRWPYLSQACSACLCRRLDGPPEALLATPRTKRPKRRRVVLLFDKTTSNHIRQTKPTGSSAGRPRWFGRAPSVAIWLPCVAAWTRALPGMRAMRATSPDRIDAREARMCRARLPHARQPRARLLRAGAYPVRVAARPARTPRATIAAACVRVRPSTPRTSPPMVASPGPERKTRRRRPGLSRCPSACRKSGCSRCPSL